MVMLAGLLAIRNFRYPSTRPSRRRRSPSTPPIRAPRPDGAGHGHPGHRAEAERIDNLIYMSSTSDSAGAVSITLTFKAGTDPNIAQVQVQNKLQLAVPLCPDRARQGIQVSSPPGTSC